MDIRFYDLKGKLRLISNDYIKVSMVRHLRQDRVCHAEFMVGHEIFDLLEEEKALVAEYGTFQTITCGYTIENGVLKINLKPLITLFSRRIVICENLSLRGNPLSLICQLISQKAGYISQKGVVASLPEREFLIEKTCDLLTIINRLLEGTKIGIHVEFIHETGEFIYSFLYPSERQIRMSSGNRNLSKITCKSDFEKVENSAYYTAQFEPTVEITENNQDKIVNYNPKNFMKQYYISYSTFLGDTFPVPANVYVYCDTADGALKYSYEEQKTRILQITLESEPAVIFEADYTRLSRSEAESLLSIRQYRSENFDVFPFDDTLNLGDLVWVEKEIGTGRGLKQLQVTEIKRESGLSLPKIILE